jgi:ligand-binding SRPBCC domain-containing protein
MKIYCLKRRQLLPISLTEAWKFFSQPLNLPQITPPWLELKLTCTVPEMMHAGMLITYRLKPLLGLPVTWISEITHAREPEFFVDEQRFGPYRFWHHQHLFKTVKDGTEISDIVHYAFGFGMLSPLLDRLFIQPRLKNIFEYRSDKLNQLFNKPYRKESMSKA